MPAEPSSQLLSKLIRKPPTVSGPKREAVSLPSNWARTGFEGLVDLITGSLGLESDSKMNQVGQLVGMGMTPFIKKMGKPIYDEAGRLLAFDSPVDEAYQAHLASSRNKLGGVQSGRQAAAPSDAAYERMMERFNRR